MSSVSAPEVSRVLESFDGISDARTLYCSLLNFEYKDLPIPIGGWTKASKDIISEASIIAKRNDFHITYFEITRLTKTNQKNVIKDLLRNIPNCVAIFTDDAKSEYHIVSPKYEPESRYGFIIRRYVVGQHEKLSTASERLAQTHVGDQDTSASIKAKHDDAFSVEEVTKEFYEAYKDKLFKMEEELLSQDIGDRRDAKGFSQQFLNRLMFLYFIQKKGWLNSDRKFIIELIERYKRQSSSSTSIYDDWLKPLFFYSFNNRNIPSGHNLPNDLEKVFDRMPYLNGGLFRENELDKIGYSLADTTVIGVVENLLDRNKSMKSQEPNPLPDRKELDNNLFDEIGLSEEERKEVYRAVCDLVKQPLDKARSV